MFAKSDIRKITIAVEKDFYTEVYLALGQAGIIHLARPDAINSMSDASLAKVEALTREILSSVGYILNALLIASEEPGASTALALTDEDTAFVAGTKRIVDRAMRLITTIRAQSDALSRRIEQAEALGLMGIEPAAIGGARFIETIFGTVGITDWDVPSSRRFLIRRAGRYVLGVCLPEDLPKLIQFVNGYEFTDLSGELGPVSLEALRSRAEDLKRRSGIIAGYIDRLKEQKGPLLKKLHSACLTQDKILKAVRMSLISSNTMILSGWMDINDRERLAEILERVCGKRFIISEHKEPNAPVRLRNIRLFKPFEFLVKIMGMPSNAEIDPTPLTAITFVLMFGLMFGDFGQGLVLMLAGMILKRIGAKKSQDWPTQAGAVLVACGFCAAACGLLYGSTFSSEHIIPALWFNPLNDMTRLFSMTILMGVLVIMTGLLVNILNCFLNGDPAEALLEKHGLAILALYAAVVFFTLRYERNARFPTWWEISIFIVLPLILFSLKGALGPALFKSPRPHGVPQYLIETVLEIFEVFLGLFTNTISFMRVGAFALAHAALSIVTYTLAGMVDPGLKSVGALIIIICGNIFIIGFESMICAIQSMRLEYYEFFSKFFKGEGIVFLPFTLQGKTTEV
ncbi:MAG: V-type ATP synthase subunit I [Syntrophobacteraceae bacterium]